MKKIKHIDEYEERINNSSPWILIMAKNRKILLLPGDGVGPKKLLQR